MHSTPLSEFSASGYLRMNDDFQDRLLERMQAMESRMARLENRVDLAARAYSHARHQLRRIRLRPPLWKFEQYSPRPVATPAPNGRARLPHPVPRIAIVTPSYNQSRYLRATIESVLAQDYPQLIYHVQDGASTDGSVELLESYGKRVAWRSEPDGGQAQAINRGFAGVDCEIMAYLNSDDVLMPGTLGYVANFFHAHPEVDIVYGHRIFINSDGLEVGRAVLPSHHARTLMWADYVPQETMFWRRRVWDAVGAIDENFDYALDWEFILRAQAAGFKFVRLPRFLACFRVHDAQKTAAIYDVGRQEMQILRARYIGHEPTQGQIDRAVLPYLARQLVLHWNIIMMQASFGDIPDLVSKLGVVRGENPFCKVPNLGFQSAALLVNLTVRDEALVEDLAPRMLLHAIFDVGLIHIGFGIREPIVRDPNGSARERRPFRMRGERVQAFSQNVRLRPAMRFGKEQELAAGARSPNGAKADVMAFNRML